MSKFVFKRKKDYDLSIDKKSDEKSDENDIEEESDSNKKQKKDIWNGSSEFPAVEVYKNHIYFYCGVTKKSCLKLNNELRKLEFSILNDGQSLINKDQFIYLHINSFGGSVFASFSTIDTIKNLRIPVVSIIEGSAASAATMISINCHYRIIYKNSLMLIHQLSSSTWGKMSELEDEMVNLKKIMKKIKDLYKKNTNIKLKDLDLILKHDIWWDANECLKYGLVDEIYNNKLIYNFDRKKINL